MIREPKMPGNIAANKWLREYFGRDFLLWPGLFFFCVLFARIYNYPFGAYVPTTWRRIER